MSTSAASSDTEITINADAPIVGVFTIEQQYETVNSRYATKPDPAWQMIDAAGHFHAYDTEGKLPTLTSRARHVNCDGSCGGVCEGEGYDVTDWHCFICDQLIEPGRVPDPGPHHIPTMRQWSADVVTDRVLNATVTVRIIADGRIHFGVANAYTESLTHRDGLTTVNTRLVGVGPLGQRNAPAKVNF